MFRESCWYFVLVLTNFRGLFSLIACFQTLPLPLLPLVFGGVSCLLLGRGGVFAVRICFNYAEVLVF